MPRSPFRIIYSCRIRIPFPPVHGGMQGGLPTGHGIVTPHMTAGHLVALEIQGRDLILTFERRPTLRECLHRLLFSDHRLADLAIVILCIAVGAAIGTLAGHLSFPAFYQTLQP